MQNIMTNRLKMVRLAHHSNNEPLFEKNMQECLTMANSSAKVRSITDDQEQELQGDLFQYDLLCKRSAF